jgi:hypothetical protein
MPVTGATGKKRIEVPNAQILRPVCAPAVKHPAQKIAILLGRYRKIRRFAGGGVKLNTRYKLQVANAQPNKEIKQQVGVCHILVIEQGEGIEFDPVFFTALDSSDYFGEGACAGVVTAIVIVELFWAVNTYANQKLTVVQKTAPIFAEQYRISLQ